MIAIPPKWYWWRLPEHAQIYLPVVAIETEEPLPNPFGVRFVRTHQLGDMLFVCLGVQMDGYVGIVLNERWESIDWPWRPEEAYKGIPHGL